MIILKKNNPKIKLMIENKLDFDTTGLTFSFTFRDGFELNDFEFETEALSRDDRFITFDLSTIEEDFKPFPEQYNWILSIDNEQVSTGLLRKKEEE